MADLLKNAARAVWGAPLTGLILIAGCALTAATGFVQVRGFRAAFSGLFRKGTGFGVSPFAALCTSLSATVGTGNIIGVTAAVASGGAGALFWMLAVAFLGMAVKYAEGFLAVRYREKDSGGTPFGGPFLYMERGLGARFPRLKFLPRASAVFFSLVCVAAFPRRSGGTDRSPSSARKSPFRSPYSPSFRPLSRQSSSSADFGASVRFRPSPCLSWRGSTFCLRCA